MKTHGPHTVTVPAKEMARISAQGGPYLLASVDAATWHQTLEAAQALADDGDIILLFAQEA